MSKKCTPLWCEAHFEVKMYKTHHVRTTFGSCDVEKVHAVVGRCKSKCAKHTTFGPLLEIATSKKCTPLWCEAHFEVKMYKTHHVRTTFGSCDVEKVHAVVAGSTFRSQNVQNTPCSDHFWKLRCRKSARRCGAKHISKSKSINTRGSDHFWKLRCRKSARRCGAKHISKSKCEKHQGFGPLLGFRCRFAWQAQGNVHLVKSEQNVRVLKHFQLQPPLHHTTLQYITLHYNYNYTFTTFYYTTLHYTTLHCTQLHLITLHYTTLRYTTLHSTSLHYTTLHYLPLHFTTLHYTPQHYNYNYTTTLH